MKITQTDFKGSFTDARKCPPAQFPEYAFIGRSNVGKSSLINMLLQKRGLARVSNTPGKTQCINFYEVNTAWYLVDLPGYGYARTSKTNRADWEKFIRYYLQERATLQCVMLLIDCRVPPQQSDLEFADKLGAWGLPFVVIFTKADKISKNEIQQSIQRFKTAMLKNWSEFPPYFVTSAEDKQGRDELLDFITQINKKFSKSEDA